MDRLIKILVERGDIYQIILDENDIPALVEVINHKKPENPELLLKCKSVEAFAVLLEVLDLSKIDLALTTKEQRIMIMDVIMTKTLAVKINPNANINKRGEVFWHVLATASKKSIEFLNWSLQPSVLLSSVNVLTDGQKEYEKNFTEPIDLNIQNKEGSTYLHILASASHKLNINEFIHEYLKMMPDSFALNFELQIPMEISKSSMIAEYTRTRTIDIHESIVCNMIRMYRISSTPSRKKHVAYNLLDLVSVEMLRERKVRNMIVTYINVLKASGMDDKVKDIIDKVQKKIEKVTKTRSNIVGPLGAVRSISNTVFGNK